MNILDGKLYAAKIKAGIKTQVESFCIKNKRPLLACVVVEGNPASEIYVASKQRACEACGIKSMVIHVPSDVSQLALEQQIETLNNDDGVSAILLQLPLPMHLNSQSALSKISPEKDVDCLTYQNLGKLFAGDTDFAPCTATGIIKLLEEYNISIEGKHAVVIGRSLLVGRSTAALLQRKNATVTLCHSKTKNLKAITKQADILIVAIGKPHYITSEYVKEGAVVVDVGINRVDGKILGDVDFENVKDKTSFITPVPGGVGPLTVSCLMQNTLTLAQSQVK